MVHSDGPWTSPGWNSPLVPPASPSSPNVHTVAVRFVPRAKPMNRRVDWRLTFVERDRYATVVVTCAGVEVARWPLDAPTTRRVTMATVDELVHVLLAARRMGCTITLDDV